VDLAAAYLPSRDGLCCEPLLPRIAEQARQADATRSVDAGVIAGIKASDLIRLSASRSLGGVEATVRAIGDELEAIAGVCGSTAWCLWNHLCVFHYYCTTVGPDARDLLAGIVRDREWVTYPNGAGSGVTGVRDANSWVLDGKITFASGARYGEWTLVMFSHPDEDGAPALSHTPVRLDTPGVRIDPTWDGAAVRASATDDVYVDRVRTPVELARRFYPDYARRACEPEFAVVDHRYREDWAELGALWLAAQATGLASAALAEAAGQASSRKAIFGVPMAKRPGVQMNLGEAAALIAAARAAWTTGCAETDARIAAACPPSVADQLRQLGYTTAALKLCDEAMHSILRVLGGNGLRESGTFERRWRDFQAMWLHIIAHPDRVNELTGRYLLGVEDERA